MMADNDWWIIQTPFKRKVSPVTGPLAPRLHYDISDTDTVTLSAGPGSTITQLLDLSGYDHTLTVPGGFSAPTHVVADQNGLDAVSYLDANQALSFTGSVDVDAACTLFVVAIFGDGLHTFICPFGSTTADVWPCLGLGYGGTIYSQNSVGSGICNPSVSAGYHVVTVSNVNNLGLVTGAYKFYVDGAQVTTTSTDGSFHTASVVNRLGGAAVGNRQGGKFGECLLYDQVLDDTTNPTRTEIEAALKTKWGTP